MDDNYSEFVKHFTRRVAVAHVYSHAVLLVAAALVVELIIGVL